MYNPVSENKTSQPWLEETHSQTLEWEMEYILFGGETGKHFKLSKSSSTKFEAFNGIAPEILLVGGFNPFEKILVKLESIPK